MVSQTPTRLSYPLYSHDILCYVNCYVFSFWGWVVVVGLWDELCRMVDKKKAEKMLKDGDDQWQ